MGNILKEQGQDGHAEERLNVDEMESEALAEKTEDESLFLMIEMACESCGEKAQYKAYNIYCGKDAVPYVAEEFTCVSCQAVGGHRLTDAGKAVILKESIRLMREAAEKGGAEAVRGPVTLMRVSSDGEEKGGEEGIRAYRKKIEENPEDPENHIGLGNSYKFFKQYKLAEACYVKALQINPAYIEPYSNMAQIEAFKGNLSGAVAWMEKGKEHLKKPLTCKRNKVALSEVVGNYRVYYRDLQRREKEGAIDVKIVSEEAPKPKKVGRNEACPCGSGKKYKKCCLK